MELLKEARERAEAQRAEQARLEAEAERERLRLEEEARAEQRRREEEEARAQRQRDWEEASRRQQQEKEEAEALERERRETKRRQQLEAERVQRKREERQRRARLFAEQARRFATISAVVVVVLLALRAIQSLPRYTGTRESLPNTQPDTAGKKDKKAEPKPRPTPTANDRDSRKDQEPEVLRGDYESRIVAALAVANSEYASGRPGEAIKALWPFCQLDVAESLYGKRIRPWRQLLVLAAKCCSALQNKWRSEGETVKLIYWRFNEGYCTHVLARDYLSCGEIDEAWNAFDLASNIYESATTQGLRRIEEGKEEQRVVRAVVFALHNNAEMCVQFAEAVRRTEGQESSARARSLGQEGLKLARQCLALREKFLPEDADGRADVAEICRRAESLM
jgi:hypothetical protein